MTGEEFIFLSKHASGQAEALPPVSYTHLQKAARTEAFQYMKNCCADIYRQSCLFLDILKKYIPDGQQEYEPDKPINQRETTEEQQEYFSMKLLSLIHEVCEGEQFEEISAPDFYANMNLHPCNCKLKIKPREKIRVCYLIFADCLTTK